MESSSKDSQHSTVSGVEEKCNGTEVPRQVRASDRPLIGTEYAPLIIITKAPSDIDFVKGIIRYTSDMKSYMLRGQKKNEKQV